MQFDGDTLNLSPKMTIDEVAAAALFIRDRLDYIEAIGFEEKPNGFVTTSALLALLASVKKSKPGIRIPLLDEGAAEFGRYGKAYWSFT
ncbi:MAG: hypothetical protein K6347_02010 [Campylobacterales bacterium]